MKALALRFFKSILSQRKTLLGVAILIPLLSIIFASFAYAADSPFSILCVTHPSLCALSQLLPGVSGIGNSVFNSFVNGVGALLDGIVGIVALVVKAMAELAAGSMQAGIKFFIDIPTSPSNAQTPQVIKDGWNFSRQLVNMVFVLILVFIGLATILRLQSYQLQKTLPSLIIIALLVNFSGVLVGFVVDIGNIITKTFIHAGQSLDVWKPADIPFIPLGGGAAELGTHIVEIIYYLISTLVYFVVILLFGVRVLMLWTLAIFAPIAFAFYVLPETKKYWTQWLQQLIQWSILGIPISFTLYLAKKVMLAGASGFGGLVDPSSALFNLAAPFTALFILFIGITLSMQLAPAGAQKIIDVSKRSGRALGLWAGSNTWRTFGSKAEKLGANIRKRGQGIEVKADEQTRLEKFVGGTIGRIPHIGVLGKNPIARFGARMIGTGLEIGAGDINKRTSEKIRRVMGEGEKATQGKSYQEASTLMQRQLVNPGFKDWDRVVGYVNGIIKNEDSEDLMKDIESGRFSMDKMRKIYETSKMGGSPVRRPIEKALLKYALEEVDPKTHVNTFGVEEKHQKELLEKITGEDIAKDIIAPQNLDLKNPATKAQAERLIEQMVLKGSHELVPQLLKRSSLEQRQAIRELFQEKGAEWFIENNREDILSYMVSNTAQGLGLSPIKGAENRQEITDRTTITSTLAKIQDNAVRNEIMTIVKGIQNINDQKNIADILGTDPNLRTMFHGMHQDDQVGVAAALVNIKDKNIRADVATYLGKTPRLSNVADTLAFTRDPAARAKVANTLAAIPQEGVRSTTARILRREPDLAEGAGFLQDMANLSREMNQVIEDIDAATKKGNTAAAQRMQTNLNDLDNVRIPNLDAALTNWVGVNVEGSSDADRRKPLWEQLQQTIIIEKRRGRQRRGDGGSQQPGGGQPPIAGGRPRGPRGGPSGRTGGEPGPTFVRGRRTGPSPYGTPGSVASTVPPAATPATGPATRSELQIGDSVHWVSGGVQQTREPVRILRIENDPNGRKYAFIEGTSTGIPVDQLEKQTPSI